MGVQYSRLIRGGLYAGLTFFVNAVVRAYTISRSRSGWWFQSCSLLLSTQFLLCVFFFSSVP